MRRFLLVSIVPLLVACSGPTPSAPAPAVGAPSSAVTAPKAESQSASAKPEPKVASQATSQAPAKAETKPATDVRPQAAATAAPKASIAPPSENHGIALGQPVKIGSNLVAVLVTNTTDQVMTFTVKVQYRKGSDVVDVTGTVTDLLPKQTRATTANVYSVIPAGPESVSVAVTDVRNASATTPKGEIAKKIQMSEAKKVEGSANITVEVTNGDSKMQNLSLVAAYMQGDEMVAYGEGQAAGMKPGETRTITVRPISSTKPYERVSVAAKVI